MSITEDMIEQVKEGNAHYFAGSVGHWKVSTCLLTAMLDVKAQDKRSVKNHGMAATEMIVWYVPVPIDTEYAIRNYAPCLDGSVAIARCNYSEEFHKYSKRLKR